MVIGVYLTILAVIDTPAVLSCHGLSLLCCGIYAVLAHHFIFVKSCGMPYSKIFADFQALMIPHTEQWHICCCVSCIQGYHLQQSVWICASVRQLYLPWARAWAGSLLLYQQNVRLSSQSHGWWDFGWKWVIRIGFTGGSKSAQSSKAVSWLARITKRSKRRFWELTAWFAAHVHVQTKFRGLGQNHKTSVSLPPMKSTWIWYCTTDRVWQTEPINLYIACAVMFHSQHLGDPIRSPEGIKCYRQDGVLKASDRISLARNVMWHCWRKHYNTTRSCSQCFLSLKVVTHSMWWWHHCARNVGYVCQTLSYVCGRILEWPFQTYIYTCLCD